MLKKIFFMIISLSVFFSSLSCDVTSIDHHKLTPHVQEIVSKLTLKDVAAIKEVVEQFSDTDIVALEQALKSKSEFVDTALGLTGLVIIAALLWYDWRLVVFLL